MEGVAARAAAVDLLEAVAEGRMLRDAAEGLTSLPPAERARAQRLAATVLRRLAAADAALAPFLTRPPHRRVRQVLRLGVVELAEGSAPHGVVNALVAVTRMGKRTAAQAGLVNAVLRRVAEAQPRPTAPQKLPPWLRQPLVAAWSRRQVEAIEAVHAMTPPVDLTPRADAAIPEGAEPLPTGSLRLAAGTQVTALPGWDTGAYWVQDAAAALAARLLAPAPGEVVVDLCAAPGGKTLQLASAGAQVTAVDISAPRLERLRANLNRTGLAAEVVVADALSWQPPAPVDAVLLDAPCSATGTIRRHPDLPLVKTAADLPPLVALQAQLIDRALGWLRPGGRLVYCTCSILPAEGEEQLAAALARHPGLRVIPPELAGLDPQWITAQNSLRILPHHWAERGGIDGFFIVQVQKP